MASAVSTMIRGTSLTVRFDQVVDGNTIRIYLPGSDRSEPVRILSVDTEESHSLSSKLMTPWGRAAKDFAKSFFAAVEEVTIEFSDDKPLSIALIKHRENYGRLLVHVWREDVDFSEVLIRRGYSPYFTKYGHASFASHRARYIAAERAAQADNIGVWDQLSVNGSIKTNYAALKAWWDVRAAAVDDFRRLRAVDPSLLDVREDYATLRAAAGQSAVVTVFADVTSVSVVPGRYAVADIGSPSRPFTVIVPRVDAGTPGIAAGARVLALLRNRYATTDGVKTPRRGYVFLSGRLRLWRDNPQLIVDHPDAVGDLPGVRPVPTTVPLLSADVPGAEDHDPSVEPSVEPEHADDPPPVPLFPFTVTISSIIPDPAGVDPGNEVITLRATSRESTRIRTGSMLDLIGAANGASGGGDSMMGPSTSLKGWRIRDAAGRVMSLSGTIAAGEMRTFAVPSSGLSLNNNADRLFLTDATGRVVHEVSYTAADVKVGTAIQFSEGV